MARNGLYPDSVKPGIPKLLPPPDGWKQVRFKDVLKVVKRPAKLNNNLEYQLIIAKRNRGGIVERGKLKGKRILTKSQFFVKSGDFLISRRQIIHGACGIIPESLDGAIVSNEYSTLLPKSSLLIDYIKYYCHTDYFQKTCFQSSIGVDVEKMIFKIDGWLQYKFNLPPLPEQQKIAEILTTVDDKIASIEDRTQQTEKLKRGLMEKLLTEGTGHTEFKETEIGCMPKCWGIKSLGDIGVFLKGKGIAKKDLLDEGIPCVRYGEIYTVHHWIIKRFYSFIDSKTASQSIQIQENDILFAGSGETIDEIGKSIAYLDNRTAYAGGDTIILRPKINTDSAFLSACLNSESSIRQKRKMGQGNSVVHIYSRELKTLIVPFPPVPEQKQIADILSAFDDKLDVLKSKKVSYETLKKGLMEQLLTGKRRIKV